MRLLALTLAAVMTCAVTSCGALFDRAPSMPWCTAAARHAVEAEWRGLVGTLGKGWTSTTSCDADGEMIFVENAPRHDGEPMPRLATRLARVLQQQGWEQRWLHPDTSTQPPAPGVPDVQLGRLCFAKGDGGRALYAQLFDHPLGPILRVARKPAGTGGYC